MQYNSIQFTYSLSYRPAPTFTRFALWFSSNWVWNQPTHHTIQFILPLTSIHCLGNIPHRRYLRLLFRSFNVQMLIWQTSGICFFWQPANLMNLHEVVWEVLGNFTRILKQLCMANDGSIFYQLQIYVFFINSKMIKNCCSHSSQLGFFKWII